MLKTITKLVLRRGRHVQQLLQQVVADDDTRDPRHASEELTRPATPSNDETPSQPVWGKAKWYSLEKRYGFVELLDGGGDVFLHLSSLGSTTVSTLQPGVTLEFRVTRRERGPQVTEIISVRSSTAVPPTSSQKRQITTRPTALASERPGDGDGEVVQRHERVRFIVMDGSKDVFVRASTLNQAGITDLKGGQRVFVGVAEGRKGPEAAAISASA